ncbi:hypothetical protein ACUUL3_04835 [Thiovibrio sp. JS02]
MRKLLATLLVTITFITACSPSSPSKSEIEKLVTHELTKDGAGTIREVINFNVKSGELSGNHYTTIVAYDFRFKISLQDLRKQLSAELHQNQASLQEQAKASSSLMTLMFTYGDFKKGDLSHQEEEVIFTKTEKGWQLVSVGE